MHTTIESKPDLKQLSIANGGTASDSFSTIGYKSGTVQTPAALTGTALALQQSVDGGATWVPVTDSAGVAVSLTAAASKGIVMPAACFGGQPLIRFVSNGAEAAARVLTVTLQT